MYLIFNIQLSVRDVQLSGASVDQRLCRLHHHLHDDWRGRVGRRAHAQTRSARRFQTDVGGQRLVRRPVHQPVVDRTRRHRARPPRHHPHLHGPADHGRHRQPAREQTKCILLEYLFHFFVLINVASTVVLISK